MNTTPIDTMYLKGEQLTLPFDATLFNKLYKMGPYERNEWGRDLLKQNNIKVRSNCYVTVMSENGKVLRVRIINTDYKPAAYR